MPGALAKAFESSPIRRARKPGTAPLPTKRGGLAGLLFACLTRAAALLVLLALLGIVVTLVNGAWPALSAFGADFFVQQRWNPVSQHFGGLAAIYGTLVTALIAMLIAVPIAIGVAVFLTELCPLRLRRLLGAAVELLAGIPSVVFGIRGLFYLAPFLQAHVQPRMIGATENLPILSILFAGPPYGIGILTASIVLAIMILPIMAAVLRDVFETAPVFVKEAAYGVGATKWEVLRHIVLAHARRSAVGAIILGLGRALGETMAVTFVIGNSHRISASLLAPGTTISAAIANEFSEATGPLYTSSLIALGLALFLLTSIVLATARLFLARLDREPVR